MELNIKFWCNQSVVSIMILMDFEKFYHSDHSLGYCHIQRST